MIIGNELSSECSPRPVEADFTKDILTHLGLKENSTVISYAGMIRRYDSAIPITFNVMYESLPSEFSNLKRKKLQII